MAATMKPEVLTIKLFRTEPGDLGICDVSCPNENLAEAQRISRVREPRRRVLPPLRTGFAGFLASGSGHYEAT